jgi:hypothetical protein
MQDLKQQLDNKAEQLANNPTTKAVITPYGPMSAAWQI